MCIIIADNYGAIALRNILKQMDIYTIGMQILIIFWHSPLKTNSKLMYAANQGRIQDFLKGGSESGVDIEGGANPSIVSLKQGVWGRSPPEAMGY